MSDLVKIARERIDDTRVTHWVGCERDHRECLIQRMADEIERLRAERDETMSKLANLFVAFNDWKVFHSTTRLEVELQLKAAERDELRRQLDEARAEREAMANVLPGVYYMDPPDGGDASLLKQLQRLSNDAARYRLLRRKFAIISDGEGHAEFCAINLPRPTYIAPNTAIELDTALDRERLGLEGTTNTTQRGA